MKITLRRQTVAGLVQSGVRTVAGSRSRLITCCRTKLSPVEMRLVNRHRSSDYQTAPRGQKQTALGAPARPRRRTASQAIAQQPSRGELIGDELLPASVIADQVDNWRSQIAQPWRSVNRPPGLRF